MSILTPYIKNSMIDYLCGKEKNDTNIQNCISRQKELFSLVSTNYGVFRSSLENDSEYLLCCKLDLVLKCITINCTNKYEVTNYIKYFKKNYTHQVRDVCVCSFLLIIRLRRIFLQKK